MVFFEKFRFRKTDQGYPSVSLHQTKTGNYYLPDGIGTDVIINEIKKGKIFEPEIVSVAREYVKPGSVVLDVGANFGQMSILFSDMVGPRGKVYSFEADEYIFSILKRNIKANARANIVPVWGAIGEQSGGVALYPFPDFKRFGSFGSYGIDPRAKNGRKVPKLKIDDLKIKEEVSFMKVDVQGSDLFAMRGAFKLIKKNRMPIIFEFEEQFQKEFGTCWDDYLKFIDDISYRIERIVYGINYLVLPK